MKSAAAEDDVAEKLRKSKRTFMTNFQLLKKETFMRGFSAGNSAAATEAFRYTFETLGGDSADRGAVYHHHHYT